MWRLSSHCFGWYSNDLIMALLLLLMLLILQIRHSLVSKSYLRLTDWSLLDHPMLPYVYRNIFLILPRTLNVVICEHFPVFIIMSLPFGIGLHSLFFCVSFPIQTIPYLKFLLTFRSIVIVRMEHKIMTVPPCLWDFFGDSLASLWKNEGETLTI